MADKTVTYEARSRGSTVGAVSGFRHSFKTGDQIEAPEGEFDHVSDDIMARAPGYESRPYRATETTDYEPESTGSEDSLEYDVPFERGSHRGAGYYYVEQAGEIVTDEDGNRLIVGQGKEEVADKLSSVTSKQELLTIANAVED